MLDSITAFFEEAGKSRRQVARKLKEMALIYKTGNEKTAENENSTTMG